MATLPILGESIVSRDQLRTAQDSDRLKDFLESDEFDPDFVLEEGGIQLTGGDLETTYRVNSTVIPYEGIGAGKPLTVALEQVYVGDYPDALPWLPGDTGDVLVSSANKAFQVFEAAPRAIHFLQARADRRASLRTKATEEGSQLVYYSPAVVDDSIVFTFEMVVDRDLNEELGDKLGEAFSAAGVLPVFAPVAPYLVAAGQVVPLAAKAANLLAPQSLAG